MDKPKATPKTTKAKGKAAIKDLRPKRDSNVKGGEVVDERTGKRINTDIYPKP